VAGNPAKRVVGRNELSVDRLTAGDAMPRVDRLPSRYVTLCLRCAVASLIAFACWRRPSAPRRLTAHFAAAARYAAHLKRAPPARGAGAGAARNALRYRGLGGRKAGIKKKNGVWLRGVERRQNRRSEPVADA